MKLTTQQRWQIVTVAALFMPLATVQVVRLAFSGLLRVSPMSASAAPVAADLAIAEAAAAPALSVAQKRALEAIAQRRSRSGELASPMDIQPVAPKPPEQPTIVHTVPDEQAPPVAMPKTLTLTTIIKSSKGTLAVINGNVYRQGDEVEAGWKVLSIDPDRRTVELIGPRGMKIQVTQPHASDSGQ